MKIERKITYFSNPEDAEREVDDYYASLTPQQRLDLLVDMLNRWGHWNERPMVRVAQIMEVRREQASGEIAGG